MSKEKFTSGEWVTCVNGQWSDCGSWSVDNDDASTFGYVAVNVDNATICLVVSDRWDDTEMESNAHLIAAAPEMYKEILSDISWLEQMKSKFVIGSYEFRSICLRIETKTKLLAKARGEA